jgi:hypothetical protein
MFASFFMLTFFTLQIFMLTKYPFKSRLFLTQGKTVLVTLAIWLFSFLSGFSEIADNYFSLRTCLKIFVAQISVLEFSVFIQIVLNIHIIIAIKKSERSTGEHSCQNSKHKNIAKTVMILTLILFFTAFTSSVFKLIEFIFRLGHLGHSKSAKIFADIFYCYVPIMTLNFTANPILYALRLRDYRRTLLALLRQTKDKPRMKKKPRFRFTQIRLNSLTFQRGNARHCTDTSVEERSTIINGASQLSKKH